MTEGDTIFSLNVGAQTDKGRLRDHNEDSLALVPEAGLWAVADGMGGYAAGDVASAIIAEELASLGIPVSAQDQRARVLERLDRAHGRILSHGRANDVPVMGATIAALLIHGSELTCIWAGDSRIYLWRDGRLTPLTRDHSEVAQMVAAGTMTEAEARLAPRRNVITRAIGIGAEACPELVSGAVRPGDRLLICSDGLTEHLDDADLAQELALPAPPGDIAARLIAQTLARGARDNVSVVVIDCAALPNTETEAS